MNLFKLLYSAGITILYCLSASLSIATDGGGVDARPVHEELIQSEPQKTVTVVFRVTNRSDEERELIAHTEFPDRWYSIIEEFPFRLDAQRSDIRLVSFFIPQSTMAGKYTVTYYVSDRNSPAVGDFHTIHLIVKPVVRVVARLLEAPERVIAGDEYHCTFSIENASNVENHVTLSVKSGEDIPFTLETSELVLEPGESKQVPVNVVTDESLRRRLSHRLELTARLVGNGEMTVKARSFVEILPRITGMDEIYNKIPVQFTLRSKFEDDAFDLQAEFAGKGTLDEENARRIEFLLRGVDIRGRSGLGERDEYYFNFLSSDFDLFLGDKSYRLSPLTEYFRYGRGIESALDIHPFRIGGYAFETRWTEPGEREIAGYVDFSLRDTHQVGFNFLHKEGEEEEGDIYSLETSIEPMESIDVDIEYALGRIDGKARAGAGMVEVDGHHERVSYNARLIQAAPDYPGYYRNRRYISGFVILPIHDRASLSSGYRQEKVNLDLDPDYGGALMEHFCNLGLYYRFTGGTSVNLGARYRTRRDRLPDPQFDYRKGTGVVTVAHSFNKLSFNTSVETGTVDDRSSDTRTTAGRCRFSTSFRPTERQVYSGYVDYSTDRRGIEAEEGTIFAGVNSSLRLRERAFFNFGYQSRDNTTGVSRRTENARMQWTYRFLHGGEVSVTGYYSATHPSDRKGEHAWMLEYMLPFGLPVTKKRDIGRVTGQVYDEETRRPIEGVVLRIGRATAITDRDGYFLFPALKPGTHYLTMNTNEIGPGLMTVQKIPMELSVRGGRETGVRVGIIRAAVISGKMRIYRQNGDRWAFWGNQKNGPGPGEGLANIPVEIGNGTETKRRITDGEGNFEFETLLPGEWTLTFQKDRLPEYYYVEKDISSITLQPAERKILLIEVLAKKRTINGISDGGVLIEEVR